MYTLNGVILRGAFKDAAGNKYPGNWLALSTPEERERIGLIEEPDPVEPPPPLEQFKSGIIERINNTCRDRIYAKYPSPIQSSAQMGLYGQAYLDAMKEWILSMIDTSNIACDAVNSALDHAAAEAAGDFQWPI